MAWRSIVWRRRRLQALLHLPHRRTFHASALGAFARRILGCLHGAKLIGLSGVPRSTPARQNESFCPRIVICCATIWLFVFSHTGYLEPKAHNSFRLHLTVGALVQRISPRCFKEGSEEDLPHPCDHGSIGPAHTVIGRAPILLRNCASGSFQKLTFLVGKNDDLGFCKIVREKIPPLRNGGI